MKYQTKCFRVSDAVSGSSTGGFFNGSSGNNNDYTYDDNDFRVNDFEKVFYEETERSSMISDLNKGITEILYNHLNLPTHITFANGNGIEYLYNAAGQKVKKTVYDMQNNTIKIVDYLDGFQTEARGSRIPVGAKATQTKNNEQYAGGILQFFPTSEGYVAATESNEIANPYLYNYVYNYTDHLGNIRLSYTKDPVSGELEIMEETEERGSRTPNKRRSHKTNDSEQNHTATLASFDLEILNFQSLARPFGLKHAVYADPKQMYKLDEEEENLARPTYVYETEYQHKYNGKEWQDELNLNLYDYGARNYDAASGRWNVLDPLAEMYPHNSPYNYVLNNPLVYLDPDGRKVIVGNEEDRAQVLNFLSNIYGENNFEFNDDNELKFIGNKKDFKGDAKETLGVLNDLIDASYDVNVQLSGFTEEQNKALEDMGGAYTMIEKDVKGNILGASIFLSVDKLQDIPLFGSKSYMYLDSNGTLQSTKNRQDVPPNTNFTVDYYLVYHCCPINKKPN